MTFWNNIATGDWRVLSFQFGSRLEFLSYSLETLQQARKYSMICDLKFQFDRLEAQELRLEQARGPGAAAIWSTKSMSYI